MLTLDGRIDNHSELCQILDIENNLAADSLIVMAAFERWGEGCFSHFIGDWAIALWSHPEKLLYLARDHAGARSLFFHQQDGDVFWSTYLETFFHGGKSFDADEVYAACYLVGQPVRDRTPYREITAVTPAHYLVFHENGIIRRPHWRWMGKGRISYKSDSEYDEHFLGLFRQSVERRTGPGAPILAELSGGMDSTSIICMSDRLRTERGALPTDLLDTVSYYDDTDPDWNERAYFSCVEARRQKTGLHIPLPLLSEDLLPAPIRTLWPGKERRVFENEVLFEESTRSKGYRVILSGIGGDEMLGGVPTPLPELADHLASGDLRRFAERALAWCLVDRTPFVHMTRDAIKYFLEQYSDPKFAPGTLPPWSTTKLRQLLRTSIFDASEEKRSFGIEPSKIGNGRAWWILLATLPHMNPGLTARSEYRYPYLDRDLVDYLFRVPREQLLQPKRRRSMMRSALRGLVPTEILERKRKAFRSRAALAPLRNSEARIARLLEHSHAIAIGLVDPSDLMGAVHRTLHGNDGRWTHALMRLLLFEIWHEGLREHAPCLAATVRVETFVA
jgi:asparagine synthase (glutamine-hydrolysing)